MTTRVARSGAGGDPGPDPDPGLDRAYAETIATRPGEENHRRDAHARSAPRGMPRGGEPAERREARTIRDARCDRRRTARRTATPSWAAPPPAPSSGASENPERARGGGGQGARRAGSRRGSVGSRRRERDLNEPKTTRCGTIRDDVAIGGGRGGAPAADRDRPRGGRGRGRPRSSRDRRASRAHGRRGDAPPPPRRHAPNRQKKPKSHLDGRITPPALAKVRRA